MQKRGSLDSVGTFDRIDMERSEEAVEEVDVVSDCVDGRVNMLSTTVSR